MMLHDATYKPETHFFGTGPYFLGIELEMEAPPAPVAVGGYRRAISNTVQAGLDLVDRPQHFYAKRDGSLLNGWELVTHPFSKDEWLQDPHTQAAQKTFELVNRLKNELGYRSHESGRCGLHVHVSRTAFTNPRRCTTTQAQLRSPHYYWFARLINGQLFRKLSQRRQTQLDRWARQLPANRLIPGIERRNPYGYGTTLVRYPAKYEACNINPPKTVEVRIFRGNMREDRVRGAVESVIAAVEFARDSDNWGKKELDQNFVAWVGEKRETYPNLYNYLCELRLATGSRVGAVATPVRRPVMARRRLAGVGRDRFGYRLGTQAALINAVLSPVPMTADHIANLAGQVLGRTRSHLTSLLRLGHIVRRGRGLYSLPAPTPTAVSGYTTIGY